MFPTVFTKGNNCFDFLFAPLDNKALSEWVLLFREEICCLRSKIFPLRVGSTEKGGKTGGNGKVSSPKKVNSITSRKTKIVYSFDLSECNRVKVVFLLHSSNVMALKS